MSRRRSVVSGRRRSDAGEDDVCMIDHIWNFGDADERNSVGRRARLTRLFIIRTLYRYLPAPVH